MAVTYVTKSSAGLIPAGVVNDDLLIAVVTGMANKSLALPTANIGTGGVRRGGTAPTDAEILRFNRALTPTETNQVGAYLAARYRAVWVGV